MGSSLNEWTLDRIERLVESKTPESLLLEYKRSDALDRSQTKEITKDVSAFANSAGGTLIYGVSEDPNSRELPGAIDGGVDTRTVSREWIEDVVKNIRPRLDGVVIIPIPVAAGKYIYVLEIPQATTAHQATDRKYYKRYNFSCEPMADHEIRDTMRRSDVPRIEVRFGFVTRVANANLHKYDLDIELENKGQRRASDFKLSFLFPRGIEIEQSSTMKSQGQESVPGSTLVFDRYGFTLKGAFVLFPQDKWRPSENGFRLAYRVNDDSYHRVASRDDAAIHWQFWVDDALPQSGLVPFSKLNKF